ncbi:MAG: zinc-binding dehydrogenase [Chloroflexi bacterium]|nr:zinc-binding dehydrogenase [Chloroflexota bacterium]
MADTVIICAGSSQAIAQGLKCIDCGGTVLFFAPLPPEDSFPIPVYDLWRDNITLTNSYAGGPADITKAIELIRTRKIDALDMITHRLGLAETGKGFQLVANAQDSLKVIIEPQK